MKKNQNKGRLRRKIIVNMMIVIVIANLSLLIINQLFVKSNFKK